MYSQSPVAQLPFLIKVVPPSLVIMIVIDAWLVYHNIKLHSWFALLVCFPTVTLVYELHLLIRIIKWMMDQRNLTK